MEMITSDQGLVYLSKKHVYPLLILAEVHNVALLDNNWSVQEAWRLFQQFTPQQLLSQVKSFLCFHSISFEVKAIEFFEKVRRNNI